MCVYVGERSNEKFKEVVRIWGPYTILTKGDKFVEMWQDKGKGVYASGDGKLWECKYVGELMEDEDDFNKVCLCKPISAYFQSPVIRLFS